MKVAVTTGYTPLPILNMDRCKYMDLGDRMMAACHCPVHFYNDWPLKDCWMYHHIVSLGRPVPPAHKVAPDRFEQPLHRVWSDCVMHQKLAWLASATRDNHEADVFVGIDLGVLKQPNMTEQVITDFIEKLKRYPSLDHVLLPGIREKEATDHEESWERFCGAVYIVPRKLASDLLWLVSDDAIDTIEKTGKIWLETDSLVHLERAGTFPIKWYQAWWGATMFTNLPEYGS